MSSDSNYSNNEGLLPQSDIYILDGMPLPKPSRVDVVIKAYQFFSERTQDVLMHSETAAYKRHVSISYDALTQEEYKGLLDAIIGSPDAPRGEFFSLQYLDPQDSPGSTRTIECRTDKFGGELYSALLYNGLYRGVTFTCVER